MIGTVAIYPELGCGYLGFVSIKAKNGGVNLHGLESISRRLLREGSDAALAIDLHEAKGAGALGIARQCCDSDVAAALTMLSDKVLVVAAVEVVARQNQKVLDAFSYRLLEQPHILPHCIGSACMRSSTDQLCF